MLSTCVLVHTGISASRIFIQSDCLTQKQYGYHRKYDKNKTKCVNIPPFTLIISPDESWGYIGFTSVVLPPYVLTCVRDNSKTLSRISFKFGTHMYLGQERNPILR